MNLKPVTNFHTQNTAAYNTNNYGVTKNELDNPEISACAVEIDQLHERPKTNNIPDNLKLVNLNYWTYGFIYYIVDSVTKSYAPSTPLPFKVAIAQYLTLLAVPHVRLAFNIVDHEAASSNSFSKRLYEPFCQSASTLGQFGAKYLLKGVGIGSCDKSIFSKIVKKYTKEGLKNASHLAKSSPKEFLAFLKNNWKSYSLNGLHAGVVMFIVKEIVEALVIISGYSENPDLDAPIFCYHVALLAKDISEHYSRHAYFKQAILGLYSLNFLYRIYSFATGKDSITALYALQSIISILSSLVTFSIIYSQFDSQKPGIPTHFKTA